MEPLHGQMVLLPHSRPLQDGVGTYPVVLQLLDGQKCIILVAMVVVCIGLQITPLLLLMGMVENGLRLTLGFLHG